MRLPPPLPHPRPDLLLVLPPSLPAALRRKVETIVAAWVRAVEDRDAAVAEAVKLSNPGTTPLDALGFDVLKALDAATRKASAAAVQVLQCVRQCAAVFAEIHPLAAAAAAEAEAALGRVHREAARVIRQDDPLLPDARLADALQGHPDITAAEQAALTAAHHRDLCGQIAAGLPTGALAPWFRECVAAVVPSAS